MKACLGFWFVFTAAVANAGELKLTGIAVGSKGRFALLETRDTRGVPGMPILRVGEALDGYQVTAIDEKAATVKLRERETGAELELRLGIVSGEEIGPRTFHFQEADLRQVLDIYQIWSGRTVLAPVALPAGRLNLKSRSALADKEALETLERAFSEKDLLTKQHGDKFVFFLRTNQAHVPFALAELPVAGAAPEEVFPPGLVKFVKADLLQVLDVYQELTGRTVLRPNHLPHSGITVRSQTRLNRAEAIWMLDAVLLLGNVAMVPEGEKFVFAVPPAKRQGLPKFDPQAAAARISKTAKPGFIKLQDVDRLQLLEIYAALLGREVLPPEPTLPKAKVSLRTQTELTQPEAVYALETIAALNHLAFEPVGENKVRIIPAALAQKPF